MSGSWISQKNLDAICAPGRLWEWLAEESMTELKIEAGGCYRTRDGRKAYVMFTHPHNPTYPFVGHIDAEGGVHVWTARGAVFRSAASSENDLISEWKEPRKGEVWIGIAESGHPYVESWSNCDGTHGVKGFWPNAPRLVARVCIPWTEGQGLTDGEGSE